ncbi:MAG: efflux RND transporter periplasmic adaptor subunit [Eubacteriaceae bacterium]
MKKKGIIIGSIIGIIILSILGYTVFSLSQPQVIATTETIPLTKGTIQNSVSATGVVESISEVKVSHTSTDTIERIYVSLGEWVSYGDWLCQLYDKDTDTYTELKAETSGTITDIKGIKGAIANGELFTIEDTNSLKIRGKVKETDLNFLSKAMPVTIKSDAVQGASYQGTLKEIAPTAIKSKAEAPTKNAEFEIIVSLPLDTPLKIGMTTRLSIVTQEKNDIFMVPIDSVVINDNQETSLLIAEEDPHTKGIYTVASIPVTLGLENDSQVEITSDALTLGMAVITTPGNIQPGTKVLVPNAPPPAEGLTSMLPNNVDPRV